MAQPPPIETYPLVLRHWTIGIMLRTVLRTSRSQWLSLLLPLFLIPTVWQVPINLLADHFAPADAPILGPGRSASAIAIFWIGLFWNSFWCAGQMDAAVDIASKHRIRWRRFLTGVARAPAIAVISTVASFPLVLLDLLPQHADGTITNAVTSVAWILTGWLVARTALSLPFISYTGASARAALAKSWHLTRGQVLKMVVLGMILVLIAIPVFFIEVMFGGEHFYLTFGLLGVFNFITVAHFYLHAATHSTDNPTSTSALPLRTDASA